MHLPSPSRVPHPTISPIRHLDDQEVVTSLKRQVQRQMLGGKNALLQRALAGGAAAASSSSKKGADSASDMLAKMKGVCNQRVGDFCVLVLRKSRAGREIDDN